MDTLIKNGTQAPTFELPDLDGKPHALVNFLGKIAVLNFWSAECPWSERVDQAIHPLLEKWDTQAAYITIASNANETEELIRTTAGKRGLSIVLIDSDQHTANTYGAQTTPHCFILDRGGMLRYQGAFDDVTFQQRTPTTHYVEAAVEALLRGAQPNPDHTPPYGCTIVRFSGS
jgi:peroxiredoxin